MARKRYKRRADESRIGATSTALPSLAVDATPRAAGGKRKGRRMAHTPRETRVEAISVARLTELVASHPDAQVVVVSRGKRRHYAAMITYVDPSRVRPK
ncbi:MAG: hypothetical protein ACREA9_02575 [Pyrinomonadaceae bacterium]